MTTPTELGRPADEAEREGSGRVETVAVARPANSPSAGLLEGSGGAAATASPDPYTEAEFDALVSSVWSLDDDDPFRFDELLTAALAFIGRRALDVTDGRAAALLRSMEQRALWGPDHPVRQP